RDGNFAGGPQIFDPLTYDPATGRRQAFPGNTIPKARFGLIGNSALKYYPAPNAPGSAAYNNVTSASSVSDANQYHTRIDHMIGSKDLLFGRFSYSTAETISPSGLPLTGSLGDRKVPSITLQESHTFSPTTVNQFRAAWTYFRNN